MKHKRIELFVADLGGLQRHAGRVLVLLFTVLLCLSAASLLWGNDPTPWLEAAAGKARFALPQSAPPQHSRVEGAVSSVVYGIMDERELCFDSFLAIRWSDSAISDSALLPAKIYKRVTVSRSAAKLKNGDRATVISEGLTAVKPCGRVVKDDLLAVTFFDTATGKFYAVEAFVNQLLSEQEVLSIASSIRPIAGTHIHL
jgi:hypothetical protein